MLSKLALPNSKGGARHKAAPAVDPSILAAVFSKHKASVGDFGQYEHLSVNQAANGTGLTAHFELLKAMLTMCPTGDFPGTSAKAAMLTLVVQAPELNQSIYNSSVWSGMRCERLGCMLNHLRRLAREPPRMKQAASSMVGADLTKLKTLVSMMRCESESVADGLASGVCSDDDATEAETPEVPSASSEVPRKRLLKKTTSDASVDSEGFPMMISLKRQVKRALSDVSLDSEGYPSVLSKRAGHKSLASSSLAPAATKGRGGSAPIMAVTQSIPAAKAQATSHEAKTWVKMWYKASNAVGIRRAKGHENTKQIFSLSNRDWSQEDLQELGATCLAKLHKGESEESVMAWGQKELCK